MKRAERLKHKWQEKKETYIVKNEIKAEKEKFKTYRSTTKLVLWFLIANFTILEIFTGYITLSMLSVALKVGGAFDFTPIVGLISVVAGESLTYFVYCLKVNRENLAHINNQYSGEDSIDLEEENINIGEE